MSTKRFVLWSAVSSEEQAKKISLKEQLRLGHEHAAKHGGIVVAELIVPGESRNIVLFEEACRRMDAYREFYELIKKRGFDVFVFLNRGRLGRDAALSMAMVSLCHRNGVIPYDMEDPPHSLDDYKLTADRLFMGAIKSARDENEIIELKRRHSGYMPARVERGDFPGIVPWAWTTRYEVDGNEKPRRIHEINPHAVQALQIIQEQYLRRGKGMQAMADILTEQHIPSPGGKSRWHKSAVQQVIARAVRWAGIVEYNSRNNPARPYIKAKSKWPALITEDEAQALLDERKRRMEIWRIGHNPHRLSGSVWCDKCQKPMHGEHSYSRKRSDNSVHYPTELYRCMTNGRTMHKGGRISARKIYSAVRTFILAQQPFVGADTVLPEQPDQTDVIQIQIGALNKRILQYESSILSMDDALGDGVMDMQRYKRQIERVKEQIAKTQEQISELETRIKDELFEAGRDDRLAELTANGLTMLETEDIPTASAWFRRHIRIWVRDCQVVMVTQV